MSVRKCSSCGSSTRSEVPFCSECGALFPIEDERELMRQLIGASFDLKWVLVGTLVALLLQLGLVGTLWSVYGNKFLVGEKGRSLLDVNLDAVSPDWGPNSGGTRMRLLIKPDNNGINNAQSLSAVYFGGVASERFQVQNLRVRKVECGKMCVNKVTAAEGYRLCMKQCDPRELKALKKRVEGCKNQCDQVREDKRILPLFRDRKLKALRCDVCEKENKAYRKRKKHCKKECPKKEKIAKADKKRCELCTQRIPIFEARAKRCEKNVYDCWSYKDVETPRAAPLPPNLDAIADPKKRKAAQEDYKHAKKQHAADLTRIKKTARKQLERIVRVYTPKFPGKVGLVPIKLVFRSGEKLTKRQAFYYVPPEKSDQRPQIKKKKRKLHDPVRTPGFWMLLAFSCIFYFLGGAAVGRLSPGVGSKEPMAAGLFAWIGFEVVLFSVGAAGTAQLFTCFIGAPAFIGCAMFGAAFGEYTATRE